MKIKPHYYQQEAVESLYDYFREKSGNPIIALPTATGKSVVIAHFLETAFTMYPHQKVLVLTHVKELIDQNYKRLKMLWPQAPAGINSAGLNQRDFYHPIIFAGIKSVVKHTEKLGKVDLILIDECHLVGDIDESDYLKLISALTEINPYLKVIGFTATHWRSGMGKLTNGKIFTDVCYDLTSPTAFRRLIAEGFLSPVIPRRTQNLLDVTGVHMQNGDFHKGELQHSVDKYEITVAALKEAMELGYNRRKWLIFSAGVEHSIHCAEILTDLGIRCEAIHSKLKEGERDRFIKEFLHGDLQAVSNNNCLTTGFDNPMIDLIVMLRPTTSAGLWCLDENTEILTNNGFRDYYTIDVENDLCLTLNTKTGFHEYHPITGYIHRELDKDEYMINLETRHQSIRVSNKHRMLSVNRKGGFDITSAEQMAMKTDVKIPVCTRNNSNGIDLLNCELELIGLFLSDGTLDKSNNTIAISQSDRYPEIQAEIERILTECNLGWRVSHKPADPNMNCYPTLYGFKRYDVSYGKNGLRGRLSHLRGWVHLEKYFVKQISDELFNISEKQFERLLYGINLGDGTKYKSPSINWIPKTFTIATGVDSVYTNRLQALAVMNGYRCDISHNRAGCLLLYISPDKTKHVDNYSNERRWVKEIYKPEKVWCVENRNGTLVTRRRGKITVMGNCQMLGRGTRPFYGFNNPDLGTIESRFAAIAEGGKENCLVLDFAGNTRRLGPINDPYIPAKKTKGSGEAPVKVCGNCNIYVHASVTVCEHCGYEFPPAPTKLKATSGSDELIKGELPIVNELAVDRITYSLHRNHDDRPNTLRVTYYCGLQSYNEFVCIEHAENTFPRRKAEEWWKKRCSDVQPPKEISSCLYLAERLMPATHIRVWVNKKYPEILSHCFDGTAFGRITPDGSTPITKVESDFNFR